MATVFRSSGDLLADRRHAWGEALLEGGDAAAAAELFQQALERAPAWADGHAALAGARLAAGDVAGAAAAWRRCAALDPEGVLGAPLQLALIGAAEAPEAPPPGYVRALFDQYAEGFETALVERLDYVAPRWIGDAVRALGRRFARAADLGCGTGLMGAEVRPIAGHLAGVDLSGGMLAEAARKGVYDELAERDVVAWLEAGTAPIDLVLAADVLCYLGDLAPLFAAVARRLAADGVFAFTVEAAEDDAAGRWVLRDSLRYAHRRDGLERTLADAGLAARRIEAGVLRHDGGVRVAGLMVVAARAA